MIKTIGDIRKAIDNLPDEMEIALYVHCLSERDDKISPFGNIEVEVTEYATGQGFDLNVFHFCPDAYVNSQEAKKTND